MNRHERPQTNAIVNIYETRGKAVEKYLAHISFLKQAEDQVSKFFGLVGSCLDIQALRAFYYFHKGDKIQELAILNQIVEDIEFRQCQDRKDRKEGYPIDKQYALVIKNCKRVFRNRIQHLKSIGRI